MGICGLREGGVSEAMHHVAGPRRGVAARTLFMTICGWGKGNNSRHHVHGAVCDKNVQHEGGREAF